MRVAAGATKAPGMMAPPAIRVSVTWVGRASPSSGSLTKQRLRGTVAAHRTRSPVAHPDIPTHLRCPLPYSPGRHPAQESLYLGKQATMKQTDGATLAFGTRPRRSPSDCGKNKNIRSARPTAALAGIGTITTEGHPVTHEYQGR